RFPGADRPARGPGEDDPLVQNRSQAQPPPERNPRVLTGGSRMAALNVGLVQINNSFSGQNYLPYSVGLLQAYAQKHAAQPGPDLGRHQLAQLPGRRRYAGHAAARPAPPGPVAPAVALSGKRLRAALGRQSRRTLAGALGDQSRLPVLLHLLRLGFRDRG